MTPRPLKLISSMATREMLAELAAAFTAATSRAVSTEAAGGVDVAKRVAAGEPVDVVVLAGSRVDLVKSGVAIAVRAGAPVPALADEAAVKAAVLAAKSLSYSTGPSGAHLEKMFGRWGILEQIRARIVVPPPGVPVGSLVASGAAELGFQQLSEFMNLSGIQVAGPLPPEIQAITVFSGGISANCTEPGAARALLDYLASPAAAAIKERFGMQAA